MSESLNGMTLPTQTERPGALENVVRDAIALTKSERMVERIWAKDATLWKDDELSRKTIGGWLGWLRAPDASREQLGAIKEFADEVQQTFDHVLLIGMGGSSLCPEVFRRTFGKQPDSPELLVIDSTDPDTLASFERRIDLTKTLFVVASKSGSTIEPLSLYRYFFERVGQALNATSADDSSIGKQFVAITDPGTWMEGEARAKNFRRVFLNPPDIGGRYSALSLFGTVPAALMGLDADEFLTRAEGAAQECRSDVNENQAARLGAIIGACALAGRDKLTLVIDKKIAALGLWIEQLVAESTGKESVGVLPVASERLGAPEVYGDDRLFVAINVRDGQMDAATQGKLDELAAAGHPGVIRTIADELSLAAEFFIWEFATAVAGAHLQINPFDQPNVQASKDLTKRLLENTDEFARVSEQTPLAVEGELAFYAAQKVDERDLAAHLKAYLATTQANDFIALLAYVEETDDVDQLLGAIVARLRARLRVAVTAGYGPRYLHSTGQLHKGGANNGVFLIITKTDEADRDVPEADYTFGKLFNAQSLGDFAALAGEDRRVARLHLGRDTEAGLRSLLAMLND